MTVFYEIFPTFNNLNVGNIPKNTVNPTYGNTIMNMNYVMTC